MSSWDRWWRAGQFALALLGAIPAQGRATAYESTHRSFCIRTVLSGLVYPVSIVFFSDNEALVAERAGRLHLLDTLTGRSSRVHGAPRSSGLLKLAMHPDFEANRWVYVSYARRNEGTVVFSVARATFNGSSLVNVTDVFTTRPSSNGVVLYGGALLFLPDRTFLLSVGSHENVGDAQDLGTHLGTVVRLRDDGTVPEDNPFVGDRKRLSEIFTYGHRNIQGLALDGRTGSVWAVEHGPKGGDELNILSAGGNYGWPLVSSGSRYDGTPIAKITTSFNVESPVFSWGATFAPAGVMVYRGKQFPHWTGDLFIASLAQRRLSRMRISDGSIVEEEALLAELGERIRDLALDSVGNIYVSTDSNQGRVIRLSACQASNHVRQSRGLAKREPLKAASRGRPGAP